MMQAWWPLALALLATTALQHARRGRARDSYRRGAVIARARSRLLRGRLSGSAAACTITLAGIPLATLDETKHFKLIGTTGTGKSSAIHELLTRALARGDRVIVADPDGGYRACFSNPYRGDVILNPFERDSPRWDPFGELNSSFDADLLSSALIPSSPDPSAQEWRSTLR